MYPPDYKNQPATSPKDPCGFIPFNRRIKDTPNVVLQWCNITRQLIEWHYPVGLDGARIPPSELNAYFLAHNARSPSCLCASQDPDPAAYTEAVIFKKTSGRLSGEWLVACANLRCHYWILLERYYGRYGLAVKAYPLCDPNSPAPPRPILIKTEDNMFATTPTATPSSSQARRTPTASRASSLCASSCASSSRAPSPLKSSPLKRSYLDAFSSDIEEIKAAKGKEKEIDPFFVEQLAPRKRRRNSEEPFSLLMLLDASVGPGITPAQFQSLIVSCGSCGDYMTRRALTLYHRCPVPATNSGIEIIDLTGDD